MCQGDQGDDGFGQGHADLGVQEEIGCAVQPCGLEVRAGDPVEEALEQVDIEAVGIQKRQQQGGIVVVGAHLTVHDELGQHDADEGDHHGAEEEHQGEFPRPGGHEPADDKSADGAQQDLGDDGEADDRHGIHHEDHEAEPGDLRCRCTYTQTAAM